MNRWTSKKSFWPLVGALGGLFVLAIAAPGSWNRYRSAAPPRLEKVVAAEPVQAVIEDSLPAPQKFDLDILLRMRDTLFTIVDRLPHQEPPPEATTVRRSVLVRSSVLVNSEKDRLAMLDLRQRRGRSRGRALPSPSEPKPAVEPSVPAEAARPLVRHRPQVLFEQLKALVHVPEASDWSTQVVGHLRRLTMETSTGETEAAALFEELSVLARAGKERASQVSDPATQQDWLQANQALERRLGIWKAMFDPGQPQITVTDLATSQSSLQPILDEVETLLATESNGSDWREYLLLDSLADASSEEVEIDSKTRSKKQSQLALEVLSRMSDPRLTEAQTEFIATSSLRNLQQQIQPWAGQAIDLDRLLALVERYEAGRELRYAKAIARVQQQLQWSSNPRWHSLAEHLKQHYRSSNMRIAFSDELLNRMVPEQKSAVMPVRERIAGTKVRGKARTTTSLQVRLLPDAHRWQFSLEAFGKVFSNTQSDTWPARVRNTAKMQYEVKKVIVIDQQGLRASPSKATARGRHELVGVDSQLDSVPLFGSLLREIARNQNKKSRPTAMAQVKAKVVRQARQRMDEGADPKLSNLEQRFRDGVLAPIGQLALIADPLAIYTTSERAVMQLRLANDGQLGAHTPRPLAPSDSVASLQMHETVLNNALAGLELDGRRMKLPELHQFFSRKFGNADSAVPEDLPARTVLEFAARDAILVRCDGDHLNLTLSIRELGHGRDKIRNFRVHARFRPVLDGMAVKLVREGSLQFSSRRLKTGPRIILHSVLGKLLPQGQEVSLIAGNLKDDPRFAGLMVTQLVIDDGWIGLALGPAHAERNAWRTQTPERLPMSFVR